MAHILGLLRHVCTAQQMVTRPVMRVGSYCKPIYKPYMTKCDGYKLCSRYRTIYQLSYRQQYEVQLTSETKYTCCPGWEKHSDIARGCRKPICSTQCQNYGQCVAPEKCHCRHGYKGQYCEEDINECSEGTHACGQICVNNNGSYTCACHAGFVLDADRRSCKVCLTCIPEFHVMMARVDKLEQDIQTLQQDARKPQVVTVTNAVGTVNDEQLRQLDRISSLSEQISLLEERLDVCTCNENKRTGIAFGKK
ncbi:epidermal growth factor-like protein 7 isoform X2 [Ptychodera flava]|uniref:epidermal growth factor-like protein 7 isoform X2 n=1 Tax=Ptychodera flava TaxID=63121 RepID=UPI00396A5B1B